MPTLGQGVNLFFIISGFLIPTSLVRHGNPNRFLVDRVLRIMPLYVLLHVVVFSSGPLIDYKEFRGMSAGAYAENFLSNLFLLAPITGHFLVQQNSWTLTFEWGFYLLVILAYVGITSPRGAYLLALVAVASVAAVIISPLFLYFALGMAFAFMKLSVRLPNAVGCLIWCGALIAFFYASQYIGVGLGLPLSALVYGILLDADSGPARLLSHRIFQYLGRISYSLYLLHPFVLFPFVFLGSKLTGHGLSQEAWFLVYLVAGPALVLVASEISYRLIEVGLRHRLAP